MLGGCATGPSEQELRQALAAEVRKDDERYNQRMDRYGGVKWEMDGSRCSLTRSHRRLAVRSTEIEIRKTGGRTTVYEAEVPRIIETYIKSGFTEDECRAAPERKLEPQRVVDKYEYDNVTRKWHQERRGGIGGLFGISG